MCQFAWAQIVLEAYDTRLDLHWIQLRRNDHTYWGIQHAIHLNTWYQWRLRVRDAPAVATEALSYPSDGYIRWHKHVDLGHAVVERGEGSGSGQPFGDPFGSPNLDMPSFSLGLTPASQSLPSGSGTSQMPPALGLGFASFQSPHSAPYGFSEFRVPPPPSTAVSSTPHQPISQASSSDEEEREDDMDGVQHLGFGHRVGKKTVRFTPSDWP
ncbi:hypothetical protein M9H77_27017 [Catharanthus roseus]|uniref:Uncharacterized protein n=1 Tax=Catharanthus roseus TaxID=4058 RepID=A0ACC0ABQ4_CATRO|nr:hypothetical protein M9H77_27017 [Catharanthus roseus]